MDPKEEFLVIYWPREKWQRRMLRNLDKGGIRTLHDVQCRTTQEILSIPRCGHKTLRLLLQVCVTVYGQAALRKEIKRILPSCRTEEVLDKIWSHF